MLFLTYPSNALYRPRRPQDSSYYHCVEDHFETFEQVHEERFERAYGFYRPYLRCVIYRYLDCGILRNGFARLTMTADTHGRILRPLHHRGRSLLNRRC